VYLARRKAPTTVDNLYHPEIRAAFQPNTYLTAILINDRTATLKTVTIPCTLFSNNIYDKAVATTYMYQYCDTIGLH
jgi:hypothetical protein